jgi:sugar lactone lactonase YvrE
MDVAVDSAGNLYIADVGNHRIRKVNTAGIILTVAGNGSAGFSGDGGPATSAQLNQPRCVALDEVGDLYIGDSVNNRIRKVNTAGIIITVAGNGSGGCSGDGGPATSAQLGYPDGVAFDNAGNLYFVDRNFRIRKVDIIGTITTVAGNGNIGDSGDGGPALSAQLYYPSGVAVDTAGNIYFATTMAARIRKIDKAGTITTVAGKGLAGYSGDGGVATSAQLSGPLDVAVDSAGNLYIADSGNCRIRKVSTSGTITTFAGGNSSLGDGGPATAAELNLPCGVAVDAAGNLYIADYNNHRIRKVSAP